MSTPEQNPTKPHLKELTGLRGLAALHVYFLHFYSIFCAYSESAHAVVDYGPDTPPLRPPFIANAQNSVTMFFVLSGFVLTMIYAGALRTRAQKTTYVVKRIARIAPVYWLSLAIFLPFIFTAFWWTDFLNIFGGTPQKLAALVLTPLGLQSWSPLHVVWQQWNPPAWSVSCELFFYLSLPWLIGRARVQTQTWKAFLKTIGLLVLAEFALFLLWFGVVYGFQHYLLDNTETPSLAVGIGVSFAFPPIRIFDFAIGVCTGHFYLATRDVPPENPRRTAWIGNSAVLAVLALQLLPFPIAIGIAPLDAVLIYTLARGWGHASGFLRTRSCQYLGKWSYALYLIHQPILGGLAALKHGEVGPMMFCSLGNNFQGGLAHGDIFGATVLILVLSAAVHHGLEEPCRRRWVAWHTRRQELRG